MNHKPKYQFSPTLLDTFSAYLNSTELYEKLWGFSEDPKVTEQEFEQKQFQNLINRLNRVPLAWEETEAMDKGAAFNEVIDCIIDHRKSETMDIQPQGDFIEVFYNDRKFQFQKSLCKEVAQRLKGAITQLEITGEISTQYGAVALRGFIDALLPFKVVDVKTTSRYNAFKYKDYWQRIVYPYLLQQNGSQVQEVEFLVTNFKDVWTESYLFNPQTDTPKLVEVCERLIEFIELNKKLITRC